MNIIISSYYSDNSKKKSEIYRKEDGSHLLCFYNKGGHVGTTYFTKDTPIQLIEAQAEDWVLDTSLMNVNLESVVKEFKTLNNQYDNLINSGSKISNKIRLFLQS